METEKNQCNIKDKNFNAYALKIEDKLKTT